MSTGIDFIKICSSIIQPSNNEAATPATVNLFLNSFLEEIGVLQITWKILQFFVDKLWYRQTACHDMITNVGGVNINKVMSYNIDWEAAYRYQHFFTCFLKKGPNSVQHCWCIYKMISFFKRYTQDAPEVVVQLLLSRRAEMTEVLIHIPSSVLLFQNKNY